MGQNFNKICLGTNVFLRPKIMIKDQHFLPLGPNGKEAHRVYYSQCRPADRQIVQSANGGVDIQLNFDGHLSLERRGEGWTDIQLKIGSLMSLEEGTDIQLNFDDFCNPD